MIAEWLERYARAVSLGPARVRSLMRRRAGRAERWDEAEMVDRVTETFFKVQWAWAMHDADLARSWTSAAWHRKHCELLKSARSQGRSRVRAEIALVEVRVVDVDERRDDVNDGLWALIKSSMIDYEVEQATGQVLSGVPDRAAECTELWRLLPSEDRYLVDVIRSLEPAAALTPQRLPSAQDPLPHATRA